MSATGQTAPRARIVFAAAPDDGVAGAVRARGGSEVELHEHLSGSALADAARSADILVTRSSQRVDRSLLEAAAAGRLRAVVQASSGLDNIDGQAAEELGIAVVPVDPGNAVAVAELTLLSLLALVRRVRRHWHATAEGRWPDRERVADRELAGKTLGIVGLGRVGSRVARRAVAFEARVLAYDPYVEDERFRGTGAERVATLDAMLGRLDALTLHCPLTEETRGMIDDVRLSLLPHGALLVNTARGRVTDEAAVVRALDDGRLAGAAIDVFGEEPASPAGLAGHPAVIATPHVAGHTAESHARRRDRLVEALVELAGALARNGGRGERR